MTGDKPKEDAKPDDETKIICYQQLGNTGESYLEHIAKEAEKNPATIPFFKQTLKNFEEQDFMGLEPYIKMYNNIVKKYDGMLNYEG